MTKFVIWLIGMSLAFVAGISAYRYSKRKKFWIGPFELGAMAWAATLCAIIILVVLLDQWGIYPQ